MSTKVSAVFRVFVAIVLAGAILSALGAPASADLSVLGEVVDVATGLDHECILIFSGEVFCSGTSNTSGQLGHDELGEGVFYPSFVEGLPPVQQLEAGENHTCAVVNNGTVWCWGSNSDGQLAQPSADLNFSPTPLMVTGLFETRHLSVGESQACVTNYDGLIRCWGNNEGQTIELNSSEVASPVVIDFPGEAFEVAVDLTRLCAITESRDMVLCRVLAEDSSYQFDTAWAGPATDISLAPDVVCFIAAERRVHCAGANFEGHIDPSSTDDFIATPMDMGDSGFVIDPNLQSTCSVLWRTENASKVRCWGFRLGTAANEWIPFDDEVVVGGFAWAITSDDQSVCVAFEKDASCWAHGEPIPFTYSQFVLEGLTYSPFFTDDHANVLRLYRASFEREPDLTGALYWFDVVDSGATLEEIAYQFAFSAEFEAKYGASLTDTQFLTVVYQNVLGREYDQDGFDYWLGLLQDGSLTRAGVIQWISLNDEFVNAHPYPGTKKWTADSG